MKMSLAKGMALAAVPLLLLATGAGSASAQLGSGTPPPPKGFEVQSASFVSAQTGFVLGTRHCGILPCRALLEKTVNGGKTWTAVHTPAVQLTPHSEGTPANAVSSVRFTTAKAGWLFGPSLWATTDGGTHWQHVKLPGTVYMMAASGGEAYAAAKPLNAIPAHGHLYRSTVGSGKWSLVPKVVPMLSLTSFGHSAWTGTAPGFWRTANGGKTWSELSFKCPSGFPSGSVIAPSSENNVATACSNPGSPQPGFSYKVVLVSTNGGRTFHAVPEFPPIAGQIYGLAMARGNRNMITINSASGASFLYQTVDGGQSWTNSVPKKGIDAGIGFADLQYVSATTGYVVHFYGSPHIEFSKGLMKGGYNAKTHAWAWTNVSIP